MNKGENMLSKSKETMIKRHQKSLIKDGTYEEIVRKGETMKQLPPYAYTSLCPDPKYRLGTIRRK